ncbi:Uncharacterized protein FWK35_00004790 [Aphis craccivora]|uniref:Uncharacterized protein n=1 Tax=Aphis craccivora TaxID=307492 RepID=A0A6G0Z5M4_APHCR|nr:Uncharacterized protein FWK35_00004790 [Aphis craccivora]
MERVRITGHGGRGYDCNNQSQDKRGRLRRLHNAAAYKYQCGAQNRSTFTPDSQIPLNIVLDSEQSEECIDFTMIRNNAPISNFGGGFQCKSEYPWCIIEVKS